MRIKSHVKVGVSVGEGANQVVNTITGGAQSLLENGGREAGRLIGTAGKIVTDPKFWTWPFNSSK